GVGESGYWRPFGPGHRPIFEDFDNSPADGRPAWRKLYLEIAIIGNPSAKQWPRGSDRRRRLGEERHRREHDGNHNDGCEHRRPAEQVGMHLMVLTGKNSSSR